MTCNVFTVCDNAMLHHDLDLKIQIQRHVLFFFAFFFKAYCKCLLLDKNKTKQKNTQKTQVKCNLRIHFKVILHPSLFNHIYKLSEVK